MPKRIPHQDLQMITGKQKTQDYLEMQRKFGRFYFKDFLACLDRLPHRGRFLEVGPGPGYQTARVAERYRPEEIVGLECSADMIRVAEGYLDDTRFHHIRFVQGAVEDTGLVKSLGRFDLIYSTFSLHHWADPLLGVKNLYEALQEKGVLFLYDFHRGGLLYYMKLKRGLWESIRASYIPRELDLIAQTLKIRNHRIRRKGLYMDWVITRDSSAS